jgi:hypothetical protein
MNTTSSERRQARDARDAAPDRDRQHAQVGQQAHDPQDAAQAQEPQERRVLAQSGRERGEDHDEVKDVPAAAEELRRCRPEGRQPDRELDEEDAEEDVVERAQEVAVRARDRVVRLEAEHHGVRDDDREDEEVERRRVREVGAGTDDPRAAVVRLTVIGGR